MQTAADHPKLTLANVHAFARDPAAKNAQRELLAAELTALVVRAEVDAYVAPLFATYHFTDERTGEKLTKPVDLYRSKDNALANVFYAACDALHRKNGYNLPEGQCPALVAENKVLRCQNALLRIASDTFGVPFDSVYGEKRKEAIKLFCKMPKA